MRMDEVCAFKVYDLYIVKKSRLSKSCCGIIFNGLFEFYVDLGFSEAEAEAKALREAPDVLERGLSREMDASGGRVGLQEG